MRIGISGSAGAGTRAEFEACATVGGHRAVIVSAEGCVAHASASNLHHYERVLGLTLAAAAEGDAVLVQWTGEVREPSFAGRFTAGPVWLGEGGALTQDMPESGFLQQLGLFVPPARLVLKIGEPVLLTFDGD